ncbi:hypothetical protein EI94DRAFT_1698111 [Lactarius quietus]|nr:hypothetical protein EI94DRAFT_1698111 [Lactarius quietus]
MVKVFCTKPFPLFEAIGDLVDGTRASGKGAFQAGQISAFDQHDSPARSHFPNPIDSKINPVLHEVSQDMEKGMTQNNIPLRTQQKKPGSSFYNSDDFSSSIDEVGEDASSPSPSPPPTKCKHTKRAGPSTSNASKSHHMSAGQGMNAIAHSLGSIFKDMRKKRATKRTRALTLPPRLLQDPIERAIVTLEADVAFSNNEMMEVINVFITNKQIARVYATLQSSHVHTNLVTCHLAKLQEGSL